MMTRFKPQLIGCVIAATLCAGAARAQQDPSGGAPSPTQAPEQNVGAGSPSAISATRDYGQGALTAADKTFIKKALEGGNAEVQLGQLAEQKAQSQDVKDFAKQMVTDHTALGEQLAPLGNQVGITETGLTAKDKALDAKLQSLSGADFDNAYIRAMVNDHRQDLAAFRQEAQTVKDTRLKDSVDQGTSVIAGHLKMIEEIAQKHNVATTEAPSQGTVGMR